MQCPLCKEVNLVMSERQGIEIDYCPQCRGVWLDRGELDKIIERSTDGVQPTASNAPTANPPTPSAQWQPPSPTPMSPRREPYPMRPNDDYDDYRHGKKKKRGGFLGDLFDFDS